MRQNVKERLNRKLEDNNMAQLSSDPTQQLQYQQIQPRLHRNRTNNEAECKNRLVNNIDDEGMQYGHGQYDDRQYDDRQYDDRTQLSNYSTLQDPAEPTFWKSLSTGNEQLMIIVLAGLAAYALYVLSKSKDK